MKRKNLLLLLLMALCVPLAMNAQSRSTLTVYGDNTTTNEYVPIYGYWADSKSKCEFIIPKEKLSAMTGGRISAMKFYLSSSGTSNQISATFNVFVKEVSATTLTGFTGTDNATTVFNNTITIAANASNVEFDIPFSSDYIYNGGNLLVGFYQTGNTSYNRTYWTGETQSTNTSWSGYGTQTGSGRKFLPKTTFTYVVSSTPYISLNPNTATVLTGFNQTLTATYGNVSGTPTITYSSSNNNVVTVSGSGTTATVTGVAPGTATITATMNGSYTATCTITVEDPSYCTPGTGNYDGSGISNVTFGTNGVVVNNTVGGINYGNYSNLVGAVDAGTTCQVDITYKTGYTYGTIIWVDWNHSYTFEGSEAVYAGTSGSANPTTLNATFPVPATTQAGDYRMRIIGSDMDLDSYTSSLSAAANADPCGSYNYSTCHDYTLRVNAGAYTITCATTTGGTITADKNNADENDVVTITATPDTDYMLTALTYTPEGGSAQSIDINSTPYTFTMPAANVTVNATFTLPTCPKPTNLTISNLAASHATVSWTSDASEFTVRYSTATVTGSTLDPVFEDGFENGLGSWTTYALDYSSTSTNWKQYNMTNLGSNGVNETNHSGSYSAMSRSYDGSSDRSSDNWLITPQMTLGDVVKFYMNTNEDFPDSYAVYVSTGSNTVTSSSSIGDFELVQNYVNAPLEWDEVSIDISAYAGQTGYVAIRHTTYGGDFICVDDFGVYNTINTYSYGGWTTVNPNPTTNSCQLTGLSAETLYEVQVQAHCGGSDGSSNWSSTMFTTPDNCGAPQELVSSDVTANSATLSWADDKDSYNLRYRKVYFYEGFEGGTMPTGWTAIDANNDGLTWSIGYTTVHSGAYGAYDWSYVYSSDGSVTTTPDDYLVSPLLDLQGTLRVWLSGYGSNATEHYAILLSTTGNSASDFTTTLLEGNTTAQYAEVSCDLSSYEGQQGYIAIRHYNCTDQRHLYVDDFGLYGTENWVTLSPNPTTETATLTDLSMNTTYEWQVQGVNCDGNGGTTEWSDVASFTTLDGYTVAVLVNDSEMGSAIITNADGDELASPATFAPGDEVTVTATAETGYTFVNWTENDEEVSTDEEYTFTINENHDLVANFEQAKHTLTIVAEHGTVTVGSPGVTYTAPVELNENTTISVVVTADAGYSFSSWSVTGTGSSVSTQYYTTTFTMGTENATLTAIFSAQPIEFGVQGYEEGEGHWYLFTSPLSAATSPADVTNLFADNDAESEYYDLYRFEQTQELEWRNYKQEPFDLVAGTGYLYANDGTSVLYFHGTPYDGDGVIEITNEAGHNWSGYNLVGNPYNAEAWSSLPYYAMNGVGTDIIACDETSRSLGKMEGFFVYWADATASGTVTVSTTNPNAKSASLTLNVSRGRGLLDRAIVSFGNNNTLPKFQLNPSHTKVYIPREDRDYAIVSAEDEMGEMPVSFKAEKSGSYTISVTAEGVSFGYLHLIDNKTGNDVDLLQTSSYTFNALDTDYASRFKLVFATGNATGDSFAFYSNGSWVISNDGDATLQVIDVTGRVLRSERVSGCTSVGMSAAPGVYMLRLVNGDNVRVQKVVVR